MEAVDPERRGGIIRLAPQVGQDRQRIPELEPAGE